MLNRNHQCLQCGNHCVCDACRVQANAISVAANRESDSLHRRIVRHKPPLTPESLSLREGGIILWVSFPSRIQMNQKEATDVHYRRSNESLENQLRIQQSQVRRQRRWNIALGAVVVVGGLMAATGVRSVPDVIQAKKFEVVNDEGKDLL